MQNLTTLFGAFHALGCRSVLVKRLRANDNSKQQVYFGGSFEVLNLLPVVTIVPHATGTHNAPIFKAPLDFSWLHEDGTTLEPAPGAQLILYPQYPEVRFSGFLAGTASRRARLMVPRQEGRLLFVGVQDDEARRRIVGYVADAGEAITNEFIGTHGPAPDAGRVFNVLDIRNLPGGNGRQQLLAVLAAIHAKGFIAGKRLNAQGLERPCTAPNGGGYTLEAELGIIPNGRAEPDYEGWEVKSYGVADFARPNAGRITLMTPEPTGGFYHEQGAQAFVRRYGTVSTRQPDRMDFAATHVVGRLHARSGLTMQLPGYDAATGKITSADGSIALLDATGQPAASWDFASLLKHWNRKHNQAAYVPCRKAGSSYHFSNHIRLAEGTDFLRLLRAFASGAAFYDPGIKVENINTKPRTKPRSQFRINTGNLHLLYHRMSDYNITGG